jgi:shikimate dehydrogenase
MRALVLGAGGSARAAVWAMQQAGAREVSVWNRTAERAEALALELGALSVKTAEPADLLINCTSVGLRGESEQLSQLGLRHDRVGDYRMVVDLVYGAGSTQLIAAARELGVQTVDGLDVLVAQGALSLERWTGRTAPLDVMRGAARAQAVARSGA